MIIYLVTNTVNGKQYVGQTISTLAQRKKCHYSNAKNNVNNFVFYRAIRKYGKDSFTWKVVADCPNMETLNLAEKIYIYILNTIAPVGYNLMSGGNNSKHSEESIEKMKEAKVGENNPMFGKTEENNPNYGKKLSEETIQKISESQSGENNPMFGKEHSEETKRKISEAQKERWKKKK